MGGTVEVLSLSPSYFWSSSPACRHPIAALDDVIRRFAPLAVEPEPVRNVRGAALAFAQYLVVTLPDGPAKDKALDAFAYTTQLAVESAGTVV